MGIQPGKPRALATGNGRHPAPLGVGSVLPDPKDTGSVSPKAVGSVLLSLEAAGSVSPNPKDVVSASPKVMGSVSPDLEDAGSVSFDGDPYHRQPL